MKATQNKKIDIDVFNFYPKFFFSSHQIRKIVLGVLKREKVKRAYLSIVLVNQSKMRRLNKQFLSKDKTTDVLSFDLRTSGCPSMLPLMGEVIVSVDAAYFGAKQHHLSLKEELYRYLIHGLLHLIGYNDSTPSKKEKMWKRQERLLRESMKSLRSQSAKVSRRTLKRWNLETLKP